MNRQLQILALFLAAIVLAAASIAGAPSLVFGAGPTASGPDTDYHVYFPLVLNDYPPTLFGRVTQAGVPAAAVPINLRLYAGSAWTTLATVATDADGVYRFASPPGLAAGQKYVATFDNNA